MNHRERVLCSMHREQPDRVPLFYRDVPEVRSRLLRDLDLESYEALLTRFDIDFRWIGPEYVGPPLTDSEETITRDIWGVEYRYVKFNETDGYWEASTRPLAAAESIGDLDAYQWPQLDWFDFSSVEEQVAGFDEYAIMTAPGYPSPGILLPIQNMMGEQKAWTEMIANPDFFDATVEHLLSFLEPFVDRMLGAGNGRIDFFRIGDDFGGQHGLLFSPDLWKSRVQPALRRLADISRRHNAFYYHHSCGGVRELIPDFVDAGIDVLDPVQVLASGMEPTGLKRDFGSSICFSGGVDEQVLLREGSPDDVRRGVRSLLDSMAVGGGFFIGPTHNFQVDIPTANIVALYDEARIWRP